MKKLLIVFSILGLLVTVGKTNATTYVENPRSGWFSSKLEFDESTFPTGIFFENNKEFIYSFFLGFNSFDDKDENSIVSSSSIRNSSSEPVYLFIKKQHLSTPHIEKNLFKEITPPEGLVPIAKITSNEIFFVKSVSSSTNINVKEYVVASCSSIVEHKNCDSLILRWYGDSLLQNMSEAGLSKELPRPKNVMTPEPDLFSVIIYHGDKPVTIKGKITYSLNYFPLNPTYYEQKPSYHDPVQPSLLDFLPLIGFLVVFVLVFYLVFMLIRYILRKFL